MPLNTISADGLDLDRETVATITRAQGKPVDIQILATTQTGEMWFLTARAWATDRLYFSFKGGPPPGVDMSQLSTRWRDRVS